MLIAYDLETTRIASGTPELLYVTAFGETMHLSMEPKITNGSRLYSFCQILENYFLIPENNKAMFIAWNGNNYDAYFIAQALLLSDDWIIQPYMTASKALRGMKVKRKKKCRIDGKMKVLQFQFLDGISMTGMVGKSLKDFLKTFAPELPKLDIGNFDEILFNPNDASHRAYAFRDSEGLYMGMSRVRGIIEQLTRKVDDEGNTISEGLDLKPTIGNLAINYFMDNVPDGVELKNPYGDLLDVLHGPLKKGGYCWCQRQYTGPVWKYDINQAYAAAMRDAALPAGQAVLTQDYEPSLPGVYEVTISRKRKSKIPFYYKDAKNTGRFTLGDEQVKCWITSIEWEHLKNDSWNIETHTGFYWRSSFNFSGVVTVLECLRRNAPGGPSGPLGSMVKAIGNNAYGKTLETLNGLELILARECPEGYQVYDPINIENQNVFCRTKETFTKPYHLPQIGVFVTSHVRCVVRNAALLAPAAFLYADTDCVVFSEPVSLPIHKSRYGDWKIEAEGTFYRIIGKKIYFGSDGATKAKGLRTKELKEADYIKWIETQPKQIQTQRQNFLKFINGNDMFKNQERAGTDVKKSKIYSVKENGRYIPTKEKAKSSHSRTGKL